MNAGLRSQDRKRVNRDVSHYPVDEDDPDDKPPHQPAARYPREARASEIKAQARYPGVAEERERQDHERIEVKGVEHVAVQQCVQGPSRSAAGAPQPGNQMKRTGRKKRRGGRVHEVQNPDSGNDGDSRPDDEEISPYRPASIPHRSGHVRSGPCFRGS
jgi:hypothetical protein